MIKNIFIGLLVILAIWLFVQLIIHVIETNAAIKELTKINKKLIKDNENTTRGRAEFGAWVIIKLNAAKEENTKIFDKLTKEINNFNKFTSRESISLEIEEVVKLYMESEGE